MYAIRFSNHIEQDIARGYSFLDGGSDSVAPADFFASEYEADRFFANLVRFSKMGWEYCEDNIFDSAEQLELAMHILNEGLFCSAYKALRIAPISGGWYWVHNWGLSCWECYDDLQNLSESEIIDKFMSEGADACARHSENTGYGMAASSNVRVLASVGFCHLLSCDNLEQEA